jgi:hypothetical protein
MVKYTNSRYCPFNDVWSALGSGAYMDNVVVIAVVLQGVVEAGESRRIGQHLQKKLQSKDKITHLNFLSFM